MTQALPPISSLEMKHVFSVALVFLFFICVLPCSAVLASTRLIYQYPEAGTWFENAAVRRNGSILLTSLNKPGGIHSLNPFDNSGPVLITDQFDNLNSTLGIVETTPDVFWISASNFSFDPANVGTQPGTNAVYQVKFAEDCRNWEEAISVSLLTRMPHAGFLNGLTKFNDSLLLAADSALGAVWSISTETGDTKIVAQDPLMQPKPVNGFGEGINGLHFHDGTLYFSNSQQRVFAKVGLDRNSIQEGHAMEIARPVSEGSISPNWDDFTLDRSGTHAYIATEIGNSIQRINLHTGIIDVFAGSLNSTAIAEPTAVTFGRTSSDSDVLYAVTAGGLAFPVYTVHGIRQVGAQVVAVEV